MTRLRIGRWPKIVAGLARTVALLLIAGSFGHADAPPWAADGPAPRATLFAPGTISTGDDDAHVTFSPDGRTVYFLKNAPDFRHWTIVAISWTENGWGSPEVAPFSGRYADGDLSFARDGRTAYFVSTRPVTPHGAPRTDTDIWRIRIDEAGAWAEPEHVPELSSDGFEWFPNLTADGWMFFGSERRDGNLGQDGTSDLWRARLVAGKFTAPESLGPVINTAGQDIEPWVSADGRLLIFASNGRSDTRGSYDLYVSHLCGGVWSAPRNLGDAVNSANWDFGPRLSPDGRFLFFTSNRGFTDRPLDRRLSFAELTETIRGPGNGLRDVYRIETAALDLSPTCPGAEAPAS
jgi:Tol biopolymer transport system component